MKDSLNVKGTSSQRQYSQRFRVPAGEPSTAADGAKLPLSVSLGLYRKISERPGRCRTADEGRRTAGDGMSNFL